MTQPKAHDAAKRIHKAYDRGQRDFSSQDLRYLDLSWSEFSKVDLSGTLLSATLLIRTDLRESNLQRADLTATNLAEADLRGIDLREANLREVLLGGAIVNDVLWPEPEMVLQVNCRAVSDSLCLELMRYNAAYHPEPRLFDVWAADGACPYKGLNIKRVAQFQEKRELYSAGPALPAAELARRVIQEKCLIV